MKNKYIPIELINVKWLISIDWFDYGLNMIKEGRFHPKSVSLEVIKPFVSKSLLFFFDIHFKTWKSIFCDGHILKPENADLLLKLRRYIAKELFLAMPYTQTYIDNHYYTENWCFNNELHCWFDQYLCINSGEHYMRYNKKRFEQKYQSIIVSFDHTATPLWNKDTGRCIPLYEFQHWLPVTIVEKLTELYDEWCFLCLEDEDHAEFMGENEFDADYKLRDQLMEISRQIKHIAPSLEIFAYRHDRTELHYDLQEIVI